MGVIIRASAIKKEFGDFTLFEDLDFALEDGDKAGLIGANGAGKTTLIRCLMGKEAVDGGDVFLSPGLSIGYLEQLPEAAEGQSLLSNLLDMFADVFAMREDLSRMEDQMSRLEGRDLDLMMKRYGTLLEAYEREEGFACETQARRILFGLGFSEADLTRELKDFSGGEKTRANLARLLVREHQLLILDEPTNHLDLASMEWLEAYLKSYKKAFLIISHDRYFLDQVTGITFLLERGRLKRYPGSYSRFLTLKEAEDLALERVWEKRQKEIKALEAYIDRNRAGINAKQARGRQSRLDRMEAVRAPERTRRIAVDAKGLKVSRSGDKALILDRISFNYPGKPLFHHIQNEIRYQERVALIGPNGAGKSTLLKLIMGLLEPEEGKIYWGSRVKRGYFDQEHGNLHPDRTVLDEFIQDYPMTLQEIRDCLARFLFREDDIYKKISDLSGGERGRLSFLKLLLQNANFLILDEPTNHLDIASREVIEPFLRDYPGAILMVSHDRYFLDAIAGRILEITPDGLISYLGNYSDYKTKKETARLRPAEIERQTSPPKKPAKTKKNDNAAERVHKAQLRQDIQILETEIETAENRIRELSEMLTDSKMYQDNETAIKAMIQEYKALEIRLPLIYENWEQANESLTKLE